MRSSGGLFQHIISEENLNRSMFRAAKGKRNQGAVKRFLSNSGYEIPLLNKELVDGTYRPRPYRQFKILDPKPRVISCADFRDRVTHHAICAVIAPVIERRLIYSNYACRKGKGSHKAIIKAQGFSRRFRYFLKTDIRHYYPSIDHEIMLCKLRKLFREERLMNLLSVIVCSHIPGQVEGKGLPIGNLTSQWFANLYMDETDHWIKESLRIRGYIRYMDDLAIWSDSKQELFKLADKLRIFLAQSLRVELKEERTIVSPCSEGVPFLGWRVYPNLLRRDGRRLRRQRRLIRLRESQFMRGEISAESLQDCALSLNGSRAFFGFGETVRGMLDI